MGALEARKQAHGSPPSSEQPVTVRVEDLHMTYRVYEERRAKLRNLFAFKSRPYRSVRAIRGVDLTAHQGEVVGVIGPNGSGKSTLFQGVAGLLPPTQGRVLTRSRPLLLGVSSALKPKLSGRRNIYIGCLALGMARREIDERFHDIVGFAGLRRFIDMPMKTYSSGMRARLQFAIATAVIPDILLIDEALAVGDRKFKRRSWKRLDEIREHAGTVMIVSHSLGEIRRTCTRVVWLEDGVVRMEGPTEEVVDAYEEFQDRDDVDGAADA